ncbi:MAG TPA: PLP-dependent aminotransferase family protein [bacterium (Candidatus Stahlbacteria)]|nr:PLP-dependent aminotransferase family protein [Candidatus Stahlbacteria bacterium]
MFEDKLSVRAKTMKRSVIRELLKLVTEPDIISFGGGMPDPSLFPTQLVADIAQEVLEKEGKKVLQYGPTEGDKEFKQQLAKRYEKMEGIKLTEENILITTASQQGLDLVSKIFIDPGDIVIVGLPTYLGGLAAFNSYGARLIGIPLDDNGMQVDIIKERLKELRRAQRRVKFIYVVPDFQNPSGVTMSIERRKRLIEIAEAYDILIFEDTPYRDLRYSGESIPSFFSLAPRGRVVSIFTFSKILFPGMRLGYIFGSKEIIDKLVIAKQATDLCSPTFTQAIVREIMKKDLLDGHIQKLIVRYRDKRECMLAALERYMPNVDGLSWTRPDGGLFLWLKLPEYMDADKLLPRALKRKVAYIVGSAFYCDGSGKHTMRLNFSYPTFELIEKGIKRLGELIREEIA